MKTFLIFLTVLLLLSQNISSATDYSNAAYNQAITNAIDNAHTPGSYYDPSRIRSLDDSTNVTRTTSGGTEQVLVGSFTRSDRNITNIVGSQKDVFGNANVDAMWVSLAPDLYDYLKNKGYSAAQSHNEISRVLGMNITNINDMVLEMWAVKNVDNLQRPTLAVDPIAIPTAGQLGYPDPSGSNFLLPADWATKTVNITDSSGHITKTMTMADAYKEWYAGQTTSALTNRTFPWTQLGYTYLWGNGNNFPDIIGLTEFILRRRPNPTAVPVNYDYEVSGIYSQQSYIYRVLPAGKTYQDLPSNGDFHITGNMDTLWTGRRYQPTGNSVIIDSSSKVYGGQGLLISSVGYTLNNAGEISGSTDTKYNISNTKNIGVLFLGEDPDSTGAVNTIINTGTIQSPGTAIEARDATGINASTTITNTGGKIIGTTYAIQTNNGNDTVSSTTNSTIQGNVDLGEGTNSLTLDTSLMEGKINTGSGNDTINIQNNSTMIGDITSGSGDDVVNINKSYFKGYIDMGGNINDQLNVTAGSTLNFATGEIKAINLGNLQLLPDAGGLKNIKLGIDINLDRKIADLISATNVSGSERLNIVGINQIGNTPTAERIKIQAINPANGLAAKTQLSINSITTPILKYNVKYDDTTGNLLFTGGGPNYSGYNPAVMSGPVAAQVGGYLSQTNSYANAFANLDMIMLMPRSQRQTFIFKNKFAAADSNLIFSPTMIPEEEKGLWIRPFSTLENVPLENGPTVSNSMYGSLVGGDSNLISLKHGFYGVLSGYTEYNGSHQVFDGISIYQNGGLLGAMGVVYKGDFFSGLTANVGANAGESSSRSGNDNFTMLTTGIASKTGYNWELFEDKFILQPSYLMSYSYINTFDYTNADGVRITSEPLNAIQISPGIKLIWNLKKGWQPYLAVNMIWNVIDKAKFKANDVSLPELSIKPYVLYGAGVQKRWGERFTGFIQTMISNGGRNGVGFQLSFRWTI